MDICIVMTSLSRHLIAISSLILSLGCAHAQLVPGQLPPGPPAAPGQINTETKKTAPAPPPAEDTPSTFTPPSATATKLANETPGFTITTRRVLVPTSVLDPDGHGYVNGLQAADFEVLDNDKRQKVQAEITEQPMSVVLVVQANSDVEYMLPKIQKTGVLLQGLVTGSEGDVAVLSFDHQMHNIVDFTSDPDKIDDALRKIRPGSSTAAMLDALADADHMLIRHDPGNKRRRVIILMSSNVDKGSQMHLDEVIRQMQFHSITVYAINISKFIAAVMKQEPDYPRPANGGIPPEGMPPLGGGNVRSGTTDVQGAYGDGNALKAIPPLYHSIKDLFKKTPAEALSSLTGGRVYSFGTQRGLEEAITDIGKDLNSQYILSYAPSNAVMEEPGYHTIRVLVNRPGLIIRTRTGYWWGGGQMN
jgi:VWFA-related protein